MGITTSVRFIFLEENRVQPPGFAYPKIRQYSARSWCADAEVPSEGIRRNPTLLGNLTKDDILRHANERFDVVKMR